MNLVLHKMMLVLLLYSSCCPIQLVTSQSVILIRSPVNQSACAGETVNFTCVVMFTSESPGAATWFTNNGNKDASRERGHTLTDDINGRSAPANVTTVLTVTNVSISNNGADYTCVQGLNVRSDTVFLTVFGPPDDIDINVSPDTITACGFVVQWSKASSDPVCGSVWYTVTILTEGGMLIITDNTTTTNYNITGLNDNTVYRVSVIASNNAGSSSITTMSVMTNSNGLPSSPPSMISVTPLSNTSFTVNWTISDHNYSYTVIWTNLNTGVMNSFIVPENRNSHTVTGLSDNDNYNVSIIAVDVCGIITSDPITVYGPPTPQFDYCISYSDGEPAVQVISHVIVNTPRTSLSLTFSASYQTGNSNNQSAACSLLSDMQYNCTAEFAVDIIPSVDTIESVNVTVSGPYGSASSSLVLSNINQGVNAISVDERGIFVYSATLICELACFSPNLQCFVFNFTTNNMDVDVTNSTSDITGSVMTYSYPTQTITLSGLNSSTTYNYCVIATDTTNMMIVGEPVCDSFTTIKYSNGYSNGCDWCIYIGIFVAVIVAVVLTVLVVLCWRIRGKRSSKVMCFRDETVTRSSKSNVAVHHPLGDNIAYGCTAYDDKKNTTRETRMHENLQHEGTIKDDTITSAVANNSAAANSATAANNVQHTNDQPWYDKLASDDNDKAKKSEDGKPKTNEREEISEGVQQQVNDSVKPHPFFQAEEASRSQLKQPSPPSAVNQNEVSARSSEESTSLQTTTTATTTTATTNTNTAKRPPLAPINLYDPIQQHPPVIPHLNTSSGDRYALPSPKSSRASKQIDNTTSVNKEIPPYATPDKSKKTANQQQLPPYAVPNKSKKTSKKTKYTELDVLPSPTTDDTKPLTDQKTKYTEVEIPSPASEQTPVHEDS